MANNQISRLLEFANLQMAAEAFLLRDIDSGQISEANANLVARLRDGNFHASKFTLIQAETFATAYEVLAQYRNDPQLPGGAGFSATLFKNKATGELTLSLRSTEFIDDAVRDSKGTNELEIKQLGWAFGQIAEMEQWYTQLCGSTNLLADGNGGIRNFNVTGYSLAGHLATAFNILRREEAIANGNPSPVVSTFTFNGAGTGAILNGRRLTDIISDFNRIRANYAVSPEWTSISQPERDTYVAAAQLRLDQIIAEEARVAGLSGVTRAFGAPAPAGSQASLDYQIAALLVHQNTVGASNFPLPGGTNYFPSSPVYVADALRFANMTEIVGMETGGLATSFVANSGVHYGYRQEVAIEAQPEIRGLFPILYLLGFNLLVDNPDSNNFADTHSLVLIVDSLSLMAAMERLAPTLTIEAAGQLLAAMSNAKADQLLFTQGKAEGDTLEKMLDALRNLAFGPGQNPTINRDQMLALLEGNTWHTSEFRTPFHERLTELLQRITALTALNETFAFDSLLPTTGTQIAAIAGGSGALAYRYALRELNPFALIGDTANAAIYGWHNLAGQLELHNADNRTGTLTTEWIVDRADFLSYKNLANTTNVSLLQSAQVSEPQRFHDLPQNYRLPIVQPGGTEIDVLTHRVVFDGDSSDALYGGEVSDRLYGGGSSDYLEGKAGNDYLEGGSGLDLYAYSGTTQLLGSSNDGADVIRDVDGKGVLRYVYSPLFGSLQTTVMADASTKQSDTEWRSANDKFTYTTTPNDQGRIDLEVTINGDAGGSLTLKDFRDGDFGIRLWSGRATPQNVVRTFYGDKEDWDSNSVPDDGIQPAPDGFGNFLRADGQNGRNDVPSPGRADFFYGALNAEVEQFILGEGNDGAYSDGTASATSATGSEDWIQGGAGRDDLVAGAGNDLIEAGADGTYEGESGGDIAYGALGDDEIYGTDRIALTAAINAGESDSPTASKGDLLSGGPGEDWLITGPANDFLLGGSDRDLMIAGAGDDNIFGDGDVIALTRLWTAVRSITPDPQTDANVYAIEINLNELNIIGAGVGGNDVVYAGSGEDWIFAHDGDDFVDGGPGNDVAFGLSGDDVLIGGLGGDLLVGDSGANSTYFGGDYLDGGAGNDDLHGNGGNDVLIGGTGDDTLTGGAGKDIYVFNKGDGRDSIFDLPVDPAIADASVLVLGDFSRSNIKFFPGSLGIDLGPSNPEDPNSPRDVIHIDGFDQVNPEATPLIAEIRFGDGTSMSYADILTQGFDIDGTAGNDNSEAGQSPMLVGTGVADRIHGFDGDDVLFGLGGDDLLDGGAGADELIGGTGIDTIFAGDGDDQVWADDDDATIAEHGADILWGGLGNDTIRGYGGDDQLFGEDGSDTLWGEAGSDSIDGGPGDDFVYGDADDVSLADQGNDTLSGGDGNDQLIGFGGSDALSGGTGGDAIYGGSGDDLVSGDDGNDTLWGEHGADLVEGGVGDDFVYGDAVYWVFGTPIINFLDDNASDTLSGGDGHDTLNSGGGDDLLDGGSGNDLLEAVGGNDALAGGDGDDTLWAGAGNDVLSGGTGNDVLLGEAGDDLFLFDLGDGEDSIREQPDTLLDVLRFGAGISAVDITFSRGSNTTLIAWHANDVDQVILPDWYLGAGYGLDHFEFSDSTQVTATEAEASAATSYRGGSGNDALSGGATADVMRGMGGDDTLIGDAGNDTLIGGAGNDLMYGGDGADTFRISLGDGVDHIQETGQADDTLVFEANIASADVAYERVGSNLVMNHVNGVDSVIVDNWFAHAFSFKLQSVTFASDGTSYTRFDLDTLATVIPHQYTLDLDDGAKLIEDWGGVDTLTFGTGIAKADVLVSRVGVDLRLAHTNGVDQVTVKDWFNDTNKQIENVNFSATGESLTSAELTDPFLILNGTSANEVISGGEAYGETINGLAGNDSIFGLGGNDSITGGLGNDSLYGGAGSDRYYFTAGDGSDVVNEDGGVNVLQLGPGLVDVVNIASINGGRRVTFTGSSDSIDLFETGFATTEVKVELNGTSAANTLTGSNTFGDVIQGLGGNDAIAGGGGNDEIYGGLGNDTIEGGDGNDQLSGNEGDDVIDGGLLNTSTVSGVDRFWGGTGNDTLYGGSLADTYNYSLGDGQDLIVDEPLFANGQWLYSTFDQVVFGAGITSESLSGAQSGSDLVVNISPTERITLRNWMSDFMYRVDEFVFSDGSKLDTNQIMDLAFTQRGTSSNDTLTGSTGNDKLYGLGGDDSLSGLDGSDFLDGGAGNDTLNGGNGDDRYAFGAGGGQDRIVDGQGNDSVEFAAGVTASQITISRSLNSLVLGIAGTPDTLTIESFLVDSNARVENFVFTDGSMLPDATTLVNSLVNVLGTAGDDVLQGTDSFDVLYGYAGNDTLTALGDNDTAYGGADNDTLNGGAGNDNLQGEAGNDTYNYALGGGSDVISDTGGFDVVSFGAGIANTAVTTGRSGANLVLNVNVTGNTGAVTVKNYFSGQETEEIRFADATVWDVATVRAKVLTASATAGNDLILGYDSNDTINSLAGIDTVYGGAGNDTIDGGSGSDQLYGEAGNDILTAGSGDSKNAAVNNYLYGGSGDDVLIASTKTDFLYGDAGNDILRGSSGVNVMNETAGNNVFDAQGGNDPLNGGDHHDLVIGGAGNDSFDGDPDGNGLRGRDIIAFNKSSGQETILRLGSQSTITIGGGTLYSNLALEAQGTALRLKTASSHYISLTDWYSNPANKAVSTLQIVIEGTRDYKASSSNPMNNRKIQSFDFLGLVAAFDAAGRPSNFNVAGNLPNFRIGGSDTEAIGGAVVYQYARTGSISALTVDQMRSVISAAEFAVSPQPIAAASATAQSTTMVSSDQDVSLNVLADTKQLMMNEIEVTGDAGGGAAAREHPAFQDHPVAGSMHASPRPRFDSRATGTIAPPAIAEVRAMGASNAAPHGPVASSPAVLDTASFGGAPGGGSVTRSGDPESVASHRPDTVRQHGAEHDRPPDLEALAEQWFSRRSPHADLSLLDEVRRGETNVNAPASDSIAAAWEASHRWLSRNANLRALSGDSGESGADLPGLWLSGTGEACYDMPRMVVGLRNVSGHDLQSFRGLREGMSVLPQS